MKDNTGNFQTDFGFNEILACVQSDQTLSPFVTPILHSESKICKNQIK